MRKVHHTQFPETPFCRTISVTRFGVSAEKVVATIEIPNNHQGIFLPERKNSFVFFPERLATTRPIIRKTVKKLPIKTQSNVCNCILINVQGFCLPHPVVTLYASREEIYHFSNKFDIAQRQFTYLVVSVNAYII